MIDEKFDWVLFNPPYVPSSGEIDEISWSGGADGYEIIENFLNEAYKYLKRNGQILLIYSSHTGSSFNEKINYKWENTRRSYVVF